MKFSWLLMLVAALAPAMALAKPGDIDLEKIRQHFAGLTRLQADVEQTRSGRYLLKPFVSEIKLDYSPGVITWRYIKPFEQTMKVTRQGVELGNSKLPPAHSERLASLTSMLDSLFRMDLDSIRKDFSMRVAGTSVQATPLAGSSLKFVRAMDFEFDRNLDILSVVVATETDTAVMKFSNIRLEK